MAASVVLRETLALAPDIGLETRPGWEAIRRDLYLPVDRRRKVIKNHDRYRAGEEKGATPEALAGLFPFTYEVSPEVEQASYAYYLELAPEYVGSPMLSALLATYAARLGRREQALKLLETGVCRFRPATIHDHGRIRPARLPRARGCGAVHGQHRRLSHDVPLRLHRHPAWPRQPGTMVSSSRSTPERLGEHRGRTAVDPRPRSHPLGAAGRAASQVEGRGLIVLRPRRCSVVKPALVPLPGPLIAPVDGVQVTSCGTASYSSICSTTFGTKTETSCLPVSAIAFPTLRGLIQTSRQRATPIIYANDSFGIFDGDARSIVERARRGQAANLVEAIVPRREDRFVVKPRYSAFDHTPLALILGDLGIERILLAGMSTERCVTQTAIGGRENGFKVSVIASACCTVDLELEEIALAYLERVVGVRIGS